jgi:hypothetical protein
MSGEPLAPVLAHVADAQARGQIGSEHVRIAEKFFQTLPTHLDWSTREAAETHLAQMACGSGPNNSAKPPSGWRCCSTRTATAPTKPNGRGGATSRWASNARDRGCTKPG